ncbi:MAG: ATP-binding cassette domain-containing protein [Dehalococcoidia bacterium]|nr:ATP-binding cassette domain-containing protein [Dehalococcoidia bacterium]
MSAPRGAIGIHNLTVTFSRWGQIVKAIEGVNLTIPAGQWLFVVGHNGSGKSTLLRALSGRLIADAGEIRVDGDLLTSLSASRLSERVFHVHQDPLLGTAPTLTLFENLFVADATAQNGLSSRADLYAKYHDLLQPLGLADRLKQLARYLSGGERQLLALTVARLRPAAVMLLDEPLAALDPGKAELCLEQIKALNKEGKTLLQVTHDPALAMSTGDRTIVLRQGRILYDESGDKRDRHALRNAWSNNADGGISI